MQSLRPVSLRRLVRLILLLVAVSSLAAACWVAVNAPVAPGELLRYGLRRIEGHPKLEWIFVPLLRWGQAWVEQPSSSALPEGLWGQQGGTLPPQAYTSAGIPLPLDLRATSARTYPSRPATLLVFSGQDLARELKEAQQGQVIALQPGVYKLETSVRLTQSGTAQHPITVRAQPGLVRIDSSATEGFVIEGAYWVFEGLTIRGVCARHDDCEHAFHIVGRGRSIVLRNNRLEDFNAHIKINGVGGQWPDHGLVQFNTLINHQPRDTDRPIVPVDLVGASGWTVSNNIVSHFVKRQGNGISYGIFMKGGGHSGVIHENKVECTRQGISQPGIRVGVSLGGGGTDAPYCRVAPCNTEHTRGRISGNLIANCNDYGIYINRSALSMIRGNRLINTYGIDVRFPESSALMSGNELDGLVRSRDGASITHF
jgi:parallel beta-helix repeat protein